MLLERRLSPRPVRSGRWVASFGAFGRGREARMRELRTEPGGQSDAYRLLLEDVCSDLVRFLHSRGDPTRFGGVVIDREWSLGQPGVFADLRVEPEEEPPYFLEVKYGYDRASLLSHLQRKYGELAGGPDGATRLVLVVHTAEHPDWPALKAQVRASLPPEVTLEVWDEHRLQQLIAECFGQTTLSLEETELVTVRERIDQGKERLAFGDTPAAGYGEQVLRQSLLWHFGTWRLAELRHAGNGADLRHLVPPGVYERVVVVMADLSSFSRYVRDTPDDTIVRQILTDFYAKSRYQVINAGGMLFQFVGDQVLALFGIPDRRPGYVEAAARTAFRLLDIGASVSHNWQRRIDHVEPRGGVHISMAMGRVQLVSMRPLDYARLQTIGDCLQICSRLLPLADPNQIVISNMLRYTLQSTGYEFAALPPFEARNIGVLQPWRLLPAPLSTPPAESGLAEETRVAHATARG
jgi:adenylate cyclase